jgi:hypothetical protein
VPKAHVQSAGNVDLPQKPRDMRRCVPQPVIVPDKAAKA